MRTLFIILIIYCTGQPLAAQHNSHGQNLPVSIQKKAPFNFEEYKSQCRSKGDTTWLPGKEVTYLWNGDSLTLANTYTLAWYNKNSDELAGVIIMDTFTNDSLLRWSYTYDENSVTTSELFENYNQQNQTWKIDYRALLSYDAYSNIDTTLIQAWNTQTYKWHDSIASIATWIDTIQLKKYVIKEIHGSEWYSIFGFENIYFYNEQGFVYEDYQDVLNPSTQEWDKSGHASYLLNEDGSWNECIVYNWDESNKEWVMTSKQNVGDWIVFNRLPYSGYNRYSDITFQWRIYNEWFTYSKIIFKYINQATESFSKKSFASFAPGEPMFFSDTSLVINYPDKMKQRSWLKYRSSPNEEFRIMYDDSCRWYFYKGALKEMYRITIDTASNRWRPAARLVYSDFIPFVEITDIEDQPENPQKLNIIPNPATGNIEIENHHQFTAISLFDMNGRLILKKEGILDQSVISIDINGFSPGMYLVKAQAGKQTVLTEKLIVR